MNDNNIASLNRIRTIETLADNKLADEAFTEALREHNVRARQLATERLIANVAPSERKMFRNFSSNEGEQEKIICYKDVRKNKHSQKKWGDEIARLALSDDEHITLRDVDALMLKSIPVFDVTKSDFLEPRYLVEASIKFVAQ